MAEMRVLEQPGMANKAIGRRHPQWRYRLTRLIKPKRLVIDGFELTAWDSGVPKHVAKILARGDYEGAERRAILALLREGDRVLEIGACIGLVSMTAARVVGVDNVVAYEPNPSAAAVAERNFLANNLPLKLVRRAVDAEAGMRELSIGHGSWLGASFYREKGETQITVQVDAIGDIVREIRPTVLVIDTEGAERSIMAACPLDGLRAVIIEFHPDVIGSDAVLRIRERLERAGFAAIPEHSEGATEAWLRS